MAGHLDSSLIFSMSMEGIGRLEDKISLKASCPITAHIEPFSFATSYPRYRPPYSGALSNLKF